MFLRYTSLSNATVAANYKVLISICDSKTFGRDKNISMVIYNIK